ncbi:hypothetical protein [Candidatus Phytoplasma sp. AldY-WA1]|uniref:hypothetical protein n=1 Tax=Candidatus Phytoplasma sp. AldY-WA1 TaxID=2852100 RepID=UPI00254BB1E1|nr:hypothetical protein [Candidatus Phytoplasma sp. AldY-WA1]
MEQKKKKNILVFCVLVIVILFILGIIYYKFFYKKSSSQKKEEIDAERTMTDLCSHNSESFNKLLRKIYDLRTSEIPKTIEQLQQSKKDQKDMVKKSISKLDNFIPGIERDKDEKELIYKSNYNVYESKYNDLKRAKEEKYEELEVSELEKAEKESYRLYRESYDLYKDKEKELEELTKFKEQLSSIETQFPDYDECNLKDYIKSSIYIKLNKQSPYLKSFYKNIDEIDLKFQEIKKKNNEIKKKLEQREILLIFQILRQNYLEFNHLLSNNNDLSNKSVFIEIPYYLRLAIEALNDFDKKDNNFCIYRASNKRVTKNRQKSEKNKEYLVEFFEKTEQNKKNYLNEIINDINYLKNIIESHYEFEDPKSPKTIINKITKEKHMIDDFKRFLNNNFDKYDLQNNYLTFLLILGSNDYEIYKEKLNKLLESIGELGIWIRNEIPIKKR